MTHLETTSAELSTLVTSARRGDARPKRPTFGLQTRVTLYLIGLILALTVIGGVAATSTLRQSLTNEFITKGNAISTSLASVAPNYIALQDMSQLQSLVEAYAKVPGVSFVMFKDRSGQAIVHNFVPFVPRELNVLRPSSVSEQREVSYLDSETSQMRHAMGLGQPVLSGALGTVFIGMDLDLINAQASRQALLLAALLAGVGVVALILGLLFTRRLVRPIRTLATLAERVGRGDLTQLAPVQSHDEIGALANSFNNAVAQLRENEVKNAAEREQAQQLQANIGDFLDVTMNIADGDLTQRGQVTDDALGNVVDSINLAVAEIESLLSQVRGVAGEVSQGAGDMAQTAQAAAQEARAQAEGARRLTAQTGEVVGGIRFVAAEADQTRSAAARTLEASESGLDAVQRTGAGLTRVQGVMQGVAQGARDLAARSQDISEAVSAIASFSSQTSLLALGASLEAAGAGEAGRRFAVVARGVSDLAEESTGAAQRVERIIGGVQAQIQELVTQVEAGVREVNAGALVAQQAGAQLRQIAELAEQSARVSQGISAATQAQVQQVESVGASIADIAQGAARSEAQSALGQQVADRLTELVAQLSSQLGRFRLGA